MPFTHIRKHTNVRIILASSLLLALSACSTMETRTATNPGYCPATQTLMCETFAGEARCRCSDTSRVSRALSVGQYL